MYTNTIILDAELSEHLARLNETDCEAAIKILRKRLATLRKPDYYLSITVEDLPLSTRAFNVLKVKHLNTVIDIIEYGYHNLELLPHAGPQTVNEIKNTIERLVAKKKKVRGLTGKELTAALKMT